MVFAHAAYLAWWSIVLLFVIGAVVFLAMGGGKILRLWAREPVGIAIPSIAAALVFGAPQMADMLAGMRHGITSTGADDAAWHQTGLGAAVLVLAIQGWFWTRAALNARGYPDGRTGWRDRDAPVNLSWQERWAPRLTLVPPTLIALSPIYLALVGHIPWHSVPIFGVASALAAAGIGWFLAWGRRALLRPSTSQHAANSVPLHGLRVVRLFQAAPFGPYCAFGALAIAVVFMAVAAWATDFINDFLHTPTAALLALSCPVAVATILLAVLRDLSDWVLNCIRARFGGCGPTPVAAGDLLGVLTLLTLPIIGSHLANTKLLGQLYDVRFAKALDGPALVAHRPGVREAVERFLACHGNKPGPAIIVAAEGGASRSAAWTLSMLRSLDARTGGAVGANLFAISGVSGGSLGAVTYMMAQAKTFPNANDIAPSPAQQIDFWSAGSGAHGETSGPYKGIVELARADLLPPVVARLFSIDAITGFPLRGPALERAFEHFWGLPESFGMPELAEIGLLALRKGRDCLPHLILNGTDVTTGNRLLTSTIAFGNVADRLVPDGSEPVELPFSAATDVFSIVNQDITAAAAVLNSARFPGISPPGVLRSATDNDDDREVVDGGVFENYGARAAWELASAISTGYREKLTPIVILISNDTDLSSSDTTGPDGQCFANTADELNKRELEMAKQPEAQRGMPVPELLTTPSGLYHTRGGHARGEIAILRQRNCRPGERNLYDFDLPRPDVTKAEAAPMNWTLDVNTCEFILGAGRRATFNWRQATQLRARLEQVLHGLGPDSGDMAWEDSTRCNGDAPVVVPWPDWARVHAQEARMAITGP